MISTSTAAVGGGVLQLNDTAQYVVGMEYKIHQGWNQVEQTAINTETHRGEGIQSPNPR